MARNCDLTISAINLNIAESYTFTAQWSTKAPEIFKSYRDVNSASTLLDNRLPNFVATIRPAKLSSAGTFPSELGIH